MSDLNVLLVTCRCVLSHHTPAEVDFTEQPPVAKGVKKAKISCKNMKNQDFFHKKVQKVETNPNHWLLAVSFAQQLVFRT